jgi:haloalkane dehalogenase
MSEAWQAFAAFVERTEELPVGMLVRRGCATDPGDAVAAAYDAPFPSEAAKAGARAFPGLIPQQPDAPGAAKGREILDALAADDRPKLVLWADADPVLPFDVGERFAQRIGAPAPTTITGASHFLQEDRGELIGETIAGWIAGT